MQYIQEIIVFLIIALAVIYTGYKIMKRFKTKASGCDGCSSDCSGCSIMELKKQIEENKARN
ncbi:MAG TPA: FeoB-associated Cys-rich membrane protein [Lentimicrobium sp.]|nr:FeoB-associated Cys-rich membrane protein [Lentimicrobium sp.]